MSFRSVPARAAVALALGAAAVACGPGGDGRADDGPLNVVASFYPLQYVVERVGGTGVSVRNLTPVGAEPHDLELTPSDVAGLGDADLVVYLAGFSPAVDEAVEAEAGARAFDVGPFARLELSYTPSEEGRSAEGATTDPHFWLDPTRLADVADAMAARLGQGRPDHAGTYTANAAVLRRDLVALDHELATGLQQCASRQIVTSHNAFGYLAARYGLEQVGITGLTPDEEPSPADLAEVAAFGREKGVRTIYYENLVSPAVAQTVAAETGAGTAVLDPLEGLSPASPGGDYLTVMRANLTTLRTGQSCS